MKGSDLTGPRAPLKGGFFHKTLGQEKKKGNPTCEKARKEQKYCPQKGRRSRRCLPCVPFWLLRLGERLLSCHGSAQRSRHPKAAGLNLGPGNHTGVRVANAGCWLPHASSRGWDDSSYSAGLSPCPAPCLSFPTCDTRRSRVTEPPQRWARTRLELGAPSLQLHPDPFAKLEWH